jgi:hypothetical protein
MNDEETIDWKEGFPNFHWTRRTSSRRGHGGLPKVEGSILCFGKEKEEKECVRNRLILMCGKVLFMGKTCVNKSMEKKLCVASTCNGVHRRISMTKPLDFYLK